MPMFDLYAPNDLFPDGSNRQLAEELTLALLRAQGVVTPNAYNLANTAAYIHLLAPDAVHTAGTDQARTVRVQVLLPPGGLTDDGKNQLHAEATDIVTKISGDPTQHERTWVLITEATENGWGIDGRTVGGPELLEHWSE